jgi:hypothetical protein
LGTARRLVKAMLPLRGLIENLESYLMRVNVYTLLPPKARMVKRALRRRHFFLQVRPPNEKPRRDRRPHRFHDHR